MTDKARQPQLWNIPEIVNNQINPWNELLTIDPMTFGIYTLPAGGKDSQTPHNEDEVYYVIAGKSKMEIGDDIRDIAEGDLIFIPKQVHHRYIEIEEDLTLLAFIAPAYKSTHPD